MPAENALPHEVIAAPPRVTGQHQGGASLPREASLPEREVEVPSDEHLLQRAAGGDSRSFDILVGRHANRLYRLAYSLVGHAADAEDVLQESLLGALSSMRGFAGRSKVSTWLSGIVVLQSAKFRRRRRSGKQMMVRSSDLSEMPADRGGMPVPDPGLKMDLHAAMQQVSMEHRQVLVLRELERMTYEEIAGVLSVPRGTVESRLFRARAELRSKLSDYQ